MNERLPTRILFSCLSYCISEDTDGRGKQCKSRELSYGWIKIVHDKHERRDVSIIGGWNVGVQPREVHQEEALPRTGRTYVHVLQLQNST